MPEAPDGVDRLRGVAHKLLWGALVCLLVPALTWLGTALYEGLVPPADGRLAGVLTVALVLYVAPVGVVLFVLGLTAALMAWRLGRERARENGTPDR